ncbi:MAG: hypothetical protein K6F09_08420 [Clostridiales bacterium]|nr:hypothetical protein [Clostridiales bacterium]
MAIKKILAFTSAIVLVLAMASCGSKETANTETDAAEITEVLEDTTASIDEELTSEPVSEEETTAEAETTEKETETEAETKPETTEPAGPDLKSTDGILNFYKEACKKSDNNFNATQSMTLASLDGGSGAVGKAIDLFEPIAKNALADNSGNFDHVPGKYENLTVDDIQSATATDDGTTTTITINLKEQTNGPKSDSYSGSVGRGIGVIDGVDTAINELKGVTVDYSEGNISLRYSEPKIVVKVDDATGKIKSGTWSFKVNVAIDNVKAKVVLVPVTLNGAKAVIDYSVKY